MVHIKYIVKIYIVIWPLLIVSIL